jgi:hypothetical protein
LEEVGSYSEVKNADFVAKQRIMKKFEDLSIANTKTKNQF